MNVTGITRRGHDCSVHLFRSSNPPPTIFHLFKTQFALIPYLIFFLLFPYPWGFSFDSDTFPPRSSLFIIFTCSFFGPLRFLLLVSGNRSPTITRINHYTLYVFCPLLFFHVVPNFSEGHKNGKEVICINSYKFI